MTRRLRFALDAPLALLWAACLLTGTTVVADQPVNVTIRWHGQSFFEIESSKGTHVAIDPHAIEAYGKTEVTADVVLISHEHNDHNQVEVLKNAGRAKVIHGLRVNGKRLDWNPIDESFRDIHIRSVGSYHDTTAGSERGKNTIFVIEMDGLHIVHLGDLGHVLSENTVRKIGPVDVLMVPVGGIYTINGSDAKKVVEQLKPRQYVLPMHYGTKAFDDVLPADEFLDEQTNVKKLPTNKLVVATDFKPEQPVIVILNWNE